MLLQILLNSCMPIPLPNETRQRFSHLGTRKTPTHQLTRVNADPSQKSQPFRKALDAAVVVLTTSARGAWRVIVIDAVFSLGGQCTIKPLIRVDCFFLFPHSCLCRAHMKSSLRSVSISVCSEVVFASPLTRQAHHHTPPCPPC